jgi:hypothetical protein
MPKIKKTLHNPQGLSIKQRAVIADVIQNVENGKGLTLTKSTAKIYQTKTPHILSNKNLHKDNFREALLIGLAKQKIIGHNSRIETKLIEGLDAINEDSKTGVQAIDYRTRLAYIQEINKITGVYAPNQQQQSRFSLNIDTTPDMLKERIQTLQSQLLSE